VSYFETGFCTAAAEISAGVASFHDALERNLDAGSEDREQWDRGYVTAVCAYVLGWDPSELAKNEFYVAGLIDLPVLILRWIRSGRIPMDKIRQDPRRIG